MSIELTQLQGAIKRLNIAMERDFDMLNTVDGALGGWGFRRHHAPGHGIGV